MFNEKKELNENNFIRMKRMKTVNKEMIYTLGHGAVTIQINKEKAEFICRMLADWLGFEIEKKEIMHMIKNKANVNSTKAKPLGV